MGHPSPRTLGKPEHNEDPLELDTLRKMTLKEHMIHVKWYDSPKSFKMKVHPGVSEQLWGEMVEIFKMWHVYNIGEPETVLSYLRKRWAQESYGLNIWLFVVLFIFVHYPNPDSTHVGFQHLPTLFVAFFEGLVGEYLLYFLLRSLGTISNYVCCMIHLKIQLGPRLDGHKQHAVYKPYFLVGLISV